MTLSDGTRLGPYEVTGQIGAGGMGEVFRARDTKLKRDVALKVLPASFAADADRLARFQREAEILAALNLRTMRAVVEPGDSFRFRTPGALFPTSNYVVPDNAPGRFTVSADGERVLLMRLNVGATDNVAITIVQNWTAELERLVPTD